MLRQLALNVIKSIRKYYLSPQDTSKARLASRIDSEKVNWNRPPYVSVRLYNRHTALRSHIGGHLTRPPSSGGYLTTWKPENHKELTRR